MYIDRHLPKLLRTMCRVLCILLYWRSQMFFGKASSFSILDGNCVDDAMHKQSGTDATRDGITYFLYNNFLQACAAVKTFR